jgi:hypothetical protein
MRPAARYACFLAFVSVGFGQDLDKRAYEILQKNCVACHGAYKSSNLDLRTREASIAGGERGEAIVPNYPERSRLYQMVTQQVSPAMPPGKKLAEGDLETLRLWIRAGAPWPAATQEAKKDDDAARKAALKVMEDRPVTAEERSFWSFKKPVRPAVPGAAGLNPVDAFLEAKWREKNLKPSPAAGPRALVRRAYLDLWGLPPTPEQVAEFVNDKRPDAWSQLVERLLASPHYGERAARHWLDLVRYADSGGFEYDADRNNAWRYRDYVVNAFNTDKPYDLFVREQLAGDELAPGSGEAQTATGFLRHGPDHNVKNEMTRMDELDDIISVTSLSFQGLTLGCARCHNHKFDPIPQKDYYQIQAVFFSTKPKEFPLVSAEEVAKSKAENDRVDALFKALRKQKSEIEKPARDRILEEKLAKLPPYMGEAWRTPAGKRNEAQRLNARQIERAIEGVDDKQVNAKMTGPERAALAKVMAEMRSVEEQRPKPIAAAMAITEEGAQPLPSFFLHRGSPGNKGSQMEPGVLTVASWTKFEAPPAPAGAATSRRRLAFANWIASPENPLTARVMVNRIWQHHFGEGIVSTPNNFGRKGELPTHPELLDWLATEFVAKGWSVKEMHRVMLNSRAYRMASDDIEANRAVDPTNRYLWRMARPRLDIETLRDGMLAAAGMLDRTVGGPAVLPYIDPVLFQGSSKRTWNGKSDEDPSTWRRSLYVFNKRTIRYPMFESFDQPDMMSSCARRNASITAPQALLMMNNAAVRLEAKQFAERLRREAGNDAAKQVDRGFELALARLPRDSERRESVEFVRRDDNALVDFCQGLFNLNEFAFMP